MKRNNLPFKTRTILVDEDANPQEHGDTTDIDAEQFSAVAENASVALDTDSNAEAGDGTAPVSASASVPATAENTAVPADTALTGDTGNPGGNSPAKTSGSPLEREENQTVERIKITFESKYKRMILANGVYEDVIIKSVSSEVEDDPYNPGQKRTRLDLRLGITIADGSTHDFWYRVTVPRTLNDKSNLYKLLDVLGKLPGEGEDFYPDTLIDLPVMVFIKNEVGKDGNTYSNIKQILPRKVTAPVAAPAAVPVVAIADDEDVTLDYDED